MDDFKKYSPFTGNPYSKEAIELWKKMEDDQIGLSIPEERENLKRLLDECEVLLFTGKTGSGKTTHIPLILWEYLGKNKKVLCTQTKRLPTETTPGYIAKFTDGVLGKYIGFQHKYQEKITEKTQIVFSTDGKVLKDIKNDYKLSEYGGIVLDEVHERTVNIDILIALITDIMKTERKDLKIVVMSAGANMDRFEAYFKNNGLRVKEMELGSLKKSKKSIPEDLTASTGWEDYFLSEKDYPTEKIYKEKGVERILKICNDPNSLPGNIIFFLPGAGEMKDTRALLEKNLNLSKYRIVNLSSASREEEKNVALGAEGYTSQDLGLERIIILSTNVAEASLTPKNLSYVIDSGRERSSIYVPEFYSTSLDIKFITKANVKQRKGRVGRTSDGYVYFVYTKKEYDEMENFLVPNIVKSDITGTVLDLLTMKNTDDYNKLYSFLGELVDRPSFETIKGSFTRLLFLGAVDRRGSLTKLGKILSEVGTEEVELSKALLYSLVYNCREDMIKIVSMVAYNSQIGNFFNSLLKEETKDLKEKIFGRYKDSKGDHFTLIKLFDHLLENINNIQMMGRSETDTAELIEKWLNKNYFINYKDGIKNVIDAYHKMNDTIINNKVIEKYALTLKDENRVIYENEYVGLKWKSSPINYNNIDDNIIRAILSGYFMNVGFKAEEDSKTFRKLRPEVNNSKYLLPMRQPTISYNKGVSNIVTYLGISDVSKGGMTFNTASPVIDGNWIMESGLPYYINFEYYPEQQKILLSNYWKSIQKIEITNIDFLKDEDKRKKVVGSSLILERFNQELQKRMEKESLKLKKVEFVESKSKKTKKSRKK